MTLRTAALALARAAKDPGPKSTNDRMEVPSDSDRSSVEDDDVEEVARPKGKGTVPAKTVKPVEAVDPSDSGSESESDDEDEDEDQEDENAGGDKDDESGSDGSSSDDGSDEDEDSAPKKKGKSKATKSNGKVDADKPKVKSRSETPDFPEMDADDYEVRSAPSVCRASFV